MDGVNPINRDPFIRRILALLKMGNHLLWTQEKDMLKFLILSG